MKQIKITIMVLILMIAVGTGTFYFARTKYENTNTVTEVVENAITETETTISGETIREGLNDIGELATEEYYFTRVETYDKSKNIKGVKIPFTESKFVYSYDGIVKAGIDFADIRVEKDDLKKIITITLPASRILDCSIDPDTFKVYDEKTSIFNPIKVENFNETLSEMMTAAENDAKEKGVLDRSDKNAERIIKNFVMSSFSVDDYFIDIQTDK